MGNAAAYHESGKNSDLIDAVGAGAAIIVPGAAAASSVLSDVQRIRETDNISEKIEHAGSAATKLSVGVIATTINGPAAADAAVGATGLALTVTKGITGKGAEVLGEMYGDATTPSPKLHPIQRNPKTRKLGD